jgi:hypothetical protein
LYREHSASAPGQKSVCQKGFGSGGGVVMPYLFEDYARATERRELRRGQALVAIEPKVFDLLTFVIENRQRVVSRDDLIARIWDGQRLSGGEALGPYFR